MALALAPFFSISEPGITSTFKKETRVNTALVGLEYLLDVIDADPDDPADHLSSHERSMSNNPGIFFEAGVTCPVWIEP